MRSLKKENANSNMKSMVQYSYSDSKHQGGKTFCSNGESQMLKSLIARAGDLSKNNDRLKFSLVSIKFP